MLLQSFRQQSRKIVKSVSKRAARFKSSFRSQAPDDDEVATTKPITPNDLEISGDIPFIDEESQFLNGTEKKPEPLPEIMVTSIEPNAKNLNNGALCHTIIKAETARFSKLEKTLLTVENELESNAPTSVHDFLTTDQDAKIQKPFVRNARVSFNANAPVSSAKDRPALRRHLSCCPENHSKVLLRRQTIAVALDTNGLVRHGSQAGAQVDRKLTWVCCYIMTMYMISHIWKIIPNIYDALYGFDEDLAWPNWLKTIQGISHVMVVLNSTFNFLPYLFLR